MSKRAFGILLGLAGAGLGMPAGCTDGTTSPTTHPSREDSKLEGQPAWRHLTATWKEAGKIRSGQRGQYPFTLKEKEELLKQLEATQNDIDALTQRGFLNDSEAELLKKEVPELLAGVMKYREKEMAMATCYEPTMPLPAAKASVDRLSARMALLEKLAAAPALHPQAVAIVLASVQADLGTLEDQAQLSQLSPKERTRAEDLRRQVARQRMQIQVRLMEQAPQWQTIIPIWEKARRMADSGKSTMAERKQIDKEMQQALAAVEELGKCQLLLPAEVELLRQEVQTLQQAIHRNPPTDSEVTCYLMLPIIPARQSLEQLRARLPLLKQIVEAKTVHPAALQKLLPTLEADIQTLGKEEDLKRLQPDEQAQAAQVRQEAMSQLAAIKKMLSSVLEDSAIKQADPSPSK